jgi:hypothetical protein
MPDYVIYRLSDREVVGYSFARRSPEVEAQALAQELRNITQSELGGAVSDYAAIPAARQSGQVASVDDRGNVTWEPHPRRVERDNLLSSVAAKLRASGIGFTDAEIVALLKDGH